MNKNEMKKDLYRSKTEAKFDRYENGKLYYSISMLEKDYIFPINLVEGSVLAPDTLGTHFGPVIKGTLLWRWIEKAIDSNDCVCLSKPETVE